MKRVQIKSMPDWLHEKLAETGKERRESIPATMLRILCDHYGSPSGAPEKPLAPEKRADRFEERPLFASDERKESEELPGMVREVWAHYMAVIGRNPKQYTLTEKRMKMARARFQDLERRGTPRENWVLILKVCVDRLHGSAFHNGANDRKRKYLDWELMFRSVEQLEKFLDDERWRKA